MDDLKYRAYNYFLTTFKMSKSSQGWFRMANPFEMNKEQTMGINFDLNSVLCHRTGYKKGLIGFIADYEGLTRHEVYEFLETDYEEVRYKIYEAPKHLQVSLKYPPHFCSLLANNLMAERATDYVEGRGMDVEQLDLMGFGTCTEGDYLGYLVVPFKVNGELKYYLGRDFIGGVGRRRYNNPSVESVGIGKGDLFFNQDALSMYDRVFLLEGWSDAVTIGADAISSQGWSLSSTQQSILIESGLKELVIIPDKGFYDKALITAWGLSDYMDVRVLSLENFEDGKDVNEIGAKKVLAELESTPMFTPELLVNNY